MNVLPQASSLAGEVDWLIGSLLGISLLVLALVLGLLLTYAIRYRHNSGIDRGALGGKSWVLEIGWTSATLVAFFGLFVWGANLFVRMTATHAAPLTIVVIGKQWMWKVEYPGGQHEINALHLPIGRDVQLLLTSEDVIHDFGLPAFRAKRDVVPGRYEALWLRPSRVGTYRLFCDQFCGTDHASMVGEVDVLSGPDYEQWLEHSGDRSALLAQGQALFIRNGCSGCHVGGDGAIPARAPALGGLYMNPVPLADGSAAIADDRYIHDEILYPGEQLVAGYPPIMPSFAGVIGEEDLVKLVAYIKSLPAPGGSP